MRGAQVFLSHYSILPSRGQSPSLCMTSPRGASQVSAAQQSEVLAATVERSARQATHKEASSSQTYPSQAARDSAFTVDRPPQQERPFALQVDGEIPKWLNGTVVRNGAGFYAPEMGHMFDGLGMLVKFVFKDGKVETMQRCIESNSYKEYLRTGKVQFSEFGTVLPRSKAVWNILKLATNFGQGLTDNASVHTHPIKDSNTIVAMSEPVGATFKVDLDSLATLSRVEHGKDGVEGDITTAHPVVDPDGTMYNIFLSFGKSRCVAKIDPKTLERTHIADVPMDNPFSPSWIHDLPGSENYVIVPDTPVLYDMKAVMFGGGEYVAFKWDPKAQKTKFHIVPKAGGAVRTIVAPFNFMTFHYTNAFESSDGRELYLDTSAYDDAQPVNLLKLNNLRNLVEDAATIPGPLSRITIPLDGRPPSIRTLVPGEYIYAELARMNPNYKQKEYRYAYALTVKLPSSFGNSLSKFDVKEGTFKRWHESGCIPTEALMIPRPGATKEDDGVVTSLVTGADGKSFLLVLDAESFKEVARAHLPYGIAYGFHNQFMPA